MNNQDNKQTGIADISGKLNQMLRKIQDLNSQIEKIESRSTKAQNDPTDYECHEGYRIYTRNEYDNSYAFDCRAAKKEKIMRNFRLEDPKFDDYHDLRVFSDWLADMECYFDYYEISDVRDSIC